jgi:SH3-like domain-containing protein
MNGETAMKKALLGALAATVTGLATLTGAPQSAEAACVIRVESWDVLWIRQRPTSRSSKVGAIPYDACGVRVFWGSCRGSWCRVRYRGVSGWAHTRYLD